MLLLIPQHTQQLAHGGGLHAGEGVGGGDIIDSDVELDKVEDGRIIRLQHPRNKHLEINNKDHESHLPNREIPSMFFLYMLSSKEADSGVATGSSFPAIAKFSSVLVRSSVSSPLATSDPTSI